MSKGQALAMRPYHLKTDSLQGPILWRRNPSFRQETWLAYQCSRGYLGGPKHMWLATDIMSVVRTQLTHCALPPKSAPPKSSFLMSYLLQAVCPFLPEGRGHPDYTVLSEEEGAPSF